MTKPTVAAQVRAAGQQAPAAPAPPPRTRRTASTWREVPAYQIGRALDGHPVVQVDAPRPETIPAPLVVELMVHTTVFDAAHVWFTFTDTPPGQAHTLGSGELARIAVILPTLRTLFYG